MHPFDLTWVLWQVCLIFASEDYVFVVRPSDLLVRQEVVAGLLFFSFDLLLQACSYVCETLLADTIRASETLSGLGAIRITMVHHSARICRVHFVFELLI